MDQFDLNNIAGRRYEDLIYQKFHQVIEGQFFLKK